MCRTGRGDRPRRRSSPSNRKAAAANPKGGLSVSWASWPPRIKQTHNFDVHLAGESYPKKNLPVKGAVISMKNKTKRKNRQISETLTH
jgi:hypothetical protein